MYDYSKSLPGIPVIKLQDEIIYFFPFQQKIVYFCKNNFKNIHNEISAFVEKENFAQGMAGEEKIIKQLTLIVTEKCNLQCKYCYLGKRDNNDLINMDWHMAEKAINSILPRIQENIPLVSFFGGEPTLNMEIIEKSVKLINSINPDTVFHLSSNGAYHPTFNDLFTRNKFSISISCDGVDENHNKLRKMKNSSNSWPIILENLKILKSFQVPLILRITLSDLNIKTIITDIEYFLEVIGIKYFHIEIEIDKDYSNQNYSNEKICKIISCFDKIMHVLEINKGYLFQSAWQNISTPNKWFCSSMNGENIIVTPQGMITGCYREHDPKREFLMGKIGEEISFDLPLESYSLPECEDCFAKYVCGGGCLWRNMYRNNNPYKINEQICKIKKELLALAIHSLYRTSINNNISPVLAEAMFTNRILLK